jgi:hydrogenase-4 component E
MMLSVLPLLIQPPQRGGAAIDPHTLVLSIGAFFIKGILIPFLLFRSLPEEKIRQETTPTSRHLSLLAGGLVVVLAFSLRLPMLSRSPLPPLSPLIVSTALAMVLLGVLLLVTRGRALMQVIGFLVLENGVFLFGMTLVSKFPMTVELGILLDLSVGVFVMGIIICHIHRTFDHIDTTRLTSLRDTE